MGYKINIDSTVIIGGFCREMFKEGDVWDVWDVWDWLRLESQLFMAKG